MNLATIDIGTNTTLLLVARQRRRRVEVARRARRDHAARARHRHQRRAGRRGHRRDADVLRDYAASRGARRHHRRHRHRGLRRAPNARGFLDPAREILGSAVEVIDGEREAALTFRAVAESFPSALAGALVTVVDIGGGSTEIIVAERGVGEVRTACRSARCA